MRLYFYRQEHVIAERAAAAIESTYREYVRTFRFVPGEIFPYVLYSSYQEFLQTNLFPVQEGVLGVTSTLDLKLALPYFGDYRLFRDVSRHEMAHQFTIQKVREIAKEAETANPLEALPLWLIEGLAEYYAKGGLDPEAEMYALDIVLNANVREGYGLLGFFEDRPHSGLWTYKIGQARCLFLEDTYGKGTIQRILEASPLLASDFGIRTRSDFEEFLHAVTGDEPKVISAKFESWIKRRTMAAYLAARQSALDFELPEIGPHELDHEVVDAISASPGGNLLLYRSIDVETGQSSLTLLDRRRPKSRESVASDGKPGYESFHAIGGRNFDLSDRALVFTAQENGADVLYYQTFEHRARRGEDQPPKERRAAAAAALAWRLQGAKPPEVWEVDISLKKRFAYRLGERKILAAFSPALSPAGDRLAFIGLDQRGQRDVYILDGLGTDDYKLTRITHDEYAERALAWGSPGIVFSSDRTPSGHHNLFLIRPESPATARLLHAEAREQQDPLVMPDGRIFFTARERGSANSYEIEGDRVIQRTDVPTGLFHASPAHDGGLWAVYHHGGRRRIVHVPRAKLLDLVEPGAAPAAGDDDAQVRPRLALGGANEYRPFDPSNWKLDNVVAFAGVGSGGRVFGRVQALTSDRLNNHALLFDAFAYGSFELVDGQLIYLNQMSRYTWGLGLFQSLTYRADPILIPFGALFSYERFFGGTALIHYPFDRFWYVEARLALGGVANALDPFTRDYLRSRSGDQNGSPLDQWNAVNGGTRFQTRGTVIFGYDTLRWHRRGPIAGRSVRFEATGAFQPFERDAYSWLRLDAEQYFLILERLVFFVRGGAGTAFGGSLLRRFYLSSYDTLRGVNYGDTSFLFGKNYFYSTAELRLPLNAILAFAFFSDIEGIVAVDFGGVADEVRRILDRRVFDFVLGVNFILGPLVLRVHFAKPIDVSAATIPNDGNWVTNVSLGWLYF